MLLIVILLLKFGWNANEFIQMKNGIDLHTSGLRNLHFLQFRLSIVLKVAMYFSFLFVWREGGEGKY